MNLRIENMRDAIAAVGDCAGPEAAIVAQFALDLAITAQFRADAIKPARALELLRLRIARHRAAQETIGALIH